MEKCRFKIERESGVYVKAKDVRIHEKYFRACGNICPYAFHGDCDNKACKGTLKEFEACWKICIKERVVFT